MNKRAVKLNRDLISNITFCYLLSFGIFLSTFSGVVRAVIGSVYSLDSAFMYGIAVLLICINLPMLLKSMKAADMVFMGVIFSLLILSATSDKANTSMLFMALQAFFLTCVPIYFTAIAIKDTEGLDRCLKVMAYAVVLCSLAKLLWLDVDIMGTDYSQGFGYMLLPSSVVLFRATLKKFNIFSFGFWAVSLGLLLFAGARGPFFMVLGFSAVYILVNTSMKRKKSIVGLVFVLAVFAVVAINFNAVIVYAYKLSAMVGVNTRILDKFIEGEMLSSSGRNDYYAFVIDYIKTHPLIGSGLLNDRSIIARALSVPPEDAYGAYPHNFFLEVLMQFGAVAGTIIILIFVGLLLYLLLGRFKSAYKDYLIMFVFIGFLPLMFSGSYITFQGFYVLLGIMAAIIRNGRAGSYE